MNEILGLVGTAVICGAFYLMALKEKKSKEKAWDRVIDLRVEIDGLNEIIESDNKVMSKIMEQIGDLQEDVRKGADRFAEDQIKIDVLCKQIEGKDSDIADLNHELCEANHKVVELESDRELYREIAMSRYDEIRYLRRKLKVVRASRLKKVIKAEKFEGVR